MNGSFENIFVFFEKNSDTFNYDKLREYLQKYNLQEESIQNAVNKKIQFLLFKYGTPINRKIIESYEKTPVNLINFLGGNVSITNKYKLYQNMEKYFPNEYLNFMPKTFKITKDTEYNSGIFIARPVNNIKTKLRCNTGQGILLYNSKETLDIVKNHLEKYDVIMSSEYIMNPLLFKGKKFHFRSYMLSTIINNTFNSYFLDISRIFVAKKPFKHSDYFDDQIHITHNCENDYLFPLHFTKENVNYPDINQESIDNINKQMRNICKKMSIIFSDYACLINKSKNGYNVFGIDFMIDDKLNIYLAEVNQFLNFGLDYDPEARELFQNNYFKWINDVVFSQLFNQDEKIQENFNNTSLFVKKKS